MDPIALQVARESKAMTRQDVIQKAIEGSINWVQAAVVVHELLNGTLAVSHQGRLVARFTSDGRPIRKGGEPRTAA